MASGNPVVNLITAKARKYGVDPAAALAVAAVEGGHRFGAVGDNGTSYGPFQLHVGGALPAGQGAGFANSAAGIDYALRKIGEVAAGKRGRAAVEAIVRGFERPADPLGEIQRALGRYAPVAETGGAPGFPPPTQAAPPSPLPAAGPSPATLQLLAAGASLFGFDPAPLTQIAAQPVAATPPPTVTRTPPVKPAAAKVKAPPRGNTIKYLEHFAQPYGLTVTATTNGKHATNSYHYRSRAVDFGGAPAGMAALAEQALKHPQDFREMFFTGPGNPGFFIKNGRVYPNSQLDASVAADHHDHVHLAS